MTILTDPGPPPAYAPTAPISPLLQPNLSALPEHVLLSILSHLSLIDLHRSVRRTSRRLYLCSTHLLREWLLPSWEANLQGGWGSDPLGLEAPAAGGEAGVGDVPTYSAASRGQAQEASSSSGDSVFRFRSNETATFDLFIATCALELAHATASSLLARPSFSPSTAHDLFAFLQPRARLADLVVAYGCRAGLVAPIDRQRDGAGRDGGGGAVVRGEDVGVQLSPRRVEVVLPRKGGVRRVVAEVERRGRGGELVGELVGECVAGLRFQLHGG